MIDEEEMRNGLSLIVIMILVISTCRNSIDTYLELKRNLGVEWWYNRLEIIRINMGAKAMRLK